MTKIVEFEKVYLEYPDDLENAEEKEHQEAMEEYEEMLKGRTQKLSLEELQQKLEETQSLHL